MKQEMIGQLVAKYNRGGYRDERLESVKFEKNTNLVVPRWFSKKMAVFDFTSKIWSSKEIKGLDLPLYPYSSIAYSAEMKEFFVLGGYNDKIDKKLAFSARVIKIKEQLVNSYESIYVSEVVPPMKIPRVCFPSSVLITKRTFLKEDGSVFNIDKDREEEKDREDFEGIIMVAGGKSREDRVTIFCEKYDLKT